MKYVPLRALKWVEEEDLQLCQDFFGVLCRLYRLYMFLQCLAGFFQYTSCHDRKVTKIILLFDDNNLPSFSTLAPSPRVHQLSFTITRLLAMKMVIVVDSSKDAASFQTLISININSLYEYRFIKNVFWYKMTVIAIQSRQVVTT